MGGIPTAHLQYNSFLFASLPVFPVLLLTPISCLDSPFLALYHPRTNRSILEERILNRPSRTPTNYNGGLTGEGYVATAFQTSELYRLRVLHPGAAAASASRKRESSPDTTVKGEYKIRSTLSSRFTVIKQGLTSYRSRRLRCRQARELQEMWSRPRRLVAVRRKWRGRCTKKGTVWSSLQVRKHRGGC